MKRIIAIIAVPVLLGGCLPLPVTIASTAISGISFLTTGKSSTDHVISAAIEQDCALTRPIVGEAICKDVDPNGPEAGERVVVAAYPGDRDDGGFRSMNDPMLRRGAMKLDELPQGPAQVAVAMPFVGAPRTPIETPGLVADAEGAVPLPEARPQAQPLVQPLAQSPAPSQVRPIVASAPARPWTPPVPIARLDIPRSDAAPVRTVVAGERYVVIGSLRDVSRAEALAARYDGLGAEIRQVEVGSRTWNRVVVGPFAPERAREVKADLGRVDGKEPWIVRLSPAVQQIAMR